MSKARKTRKTGQTVVIDTTNSIFYDLFEAAEAEQLAIQSSLAIELEREIERRKWTQAAAAKAIGITQPRVNDLLRGRLDRFSIDALILCLLRAGLTVTVTPRRRRAA